MSLVKPTQYGQAQYNQAQYNCTVTPVNGQIDLFDNVSPTDNLNGNSGQNLADNLKITEWLTASIIKPNIWNKQTGASSIWTTVTPSTTKGIWTNADAPNQIP